MTTPVLKLPLDATRNRDGTRFAIVSETRTGAIAIADISPLRESEMPDSSVCELFQAKGEINVISN